MPVAPPVSLQYRPSSQTVPAPPVLPHAAPAAATAGPAAHVPAQHAVLRLHAMSVCVHSPPSAHSSSNTHAVPAASVPMNRSSHGLAMWKPSNVQSSLRIESRHFFACDSLYSSVFALTAPIVVSTSLPSKIVLASHVALSGWKPQRTSRSQIAAASSSGKSSILTLPPPPQADATIRTGTHR